eukprot:SAG22_NODE_4450_length_1264_cov_1.130472_1_plen_304_part_00
MASASVEQTKQIAALAAALQEQQRQSAAMMQQQQQMLQIMQQQQQQQMQQQPPPPPQNITAVDPVRRAVQPTVAESAAIKKLISGAVKEYEKKLNDLNNNQASSNALGELNLDPDPDKPLPIGTPREVKAMRAPKLRFHDGLKETHAEQLKAADKAIAVHVRAGQAEMIRQMKLIKDATISYLKADMPEIEKRLGDAVTDTLQDTLIIAADQRQIIVAAQQSYGTQQRASTVKIETKRKADAAEKAEKARMLEEEKLKKLEQNNGTTVGALMDHKIAADRARRGSETIDTDDVDEEQLTERCL